MHRRPQRSWSRRKTDRRASGGEAICQEARIPPAFSRGERQRKIEEGAHEVACVASDLCELSAIEEHMAHGCLAMCQEVTARSVPSEDATTSSRCAIPLPVRERSTCSTSSVLLS